MNIQRIISGGQTGVDRAALDFAIARQIPHGGCCPAGRRAADGVLDARYQLVETESSGYRQRTKHNVLDCRRAFKSTQRCALNFTQGL